MVVFYDISYVNHACTKSAHRWPAIYYTSEGKGVVERLWRETLEELEFAVASRIVNNLSNK